MMCSHNWQCAGGGIVMKGVRIVMCHSELEATALKVVCGWFDNYQTAFAEAPCTLHRIKG